MTSYSRSEARERVHAELDKLERMVDAALRPGTSNVFEWLASTLWIDRARTLALSAQTAERLGVLGSETVPANRQDALEFKGCRNSSTRPNQMVALLASIVAGRGDEQVDAGLCAELVSFAILQPRVNPPFRSLFWLALESEVRPAGMEPSAQLAERLGPMAYDLAQLPEERDDGPSVRAAQLEFLGYFFPEGFDPVSCESASDAELARYCDQLLARNGCPFLFGEVAVGAERRTA